MKVVDQLGDRVMMDPDWYGPPRTVDFTRLPDDIMNYFSDLRHRDFNLRHRAGEWPVALQREDLYVPMRQVGRDERRRNPGYGIARFQHYEFDKPNRDRVPYVLAGLGMGVAGLGIAGYWEDLKSLGTKAARFYAPDTAKAQHVQSAAQMTNEEYLLKVDKYTGYGVPDPVQQTAFDAKKQTNAYWGHEYAKAYTAKGRYEIHFENTHLAPPVKPLMRPMTDDTGREII